MQIKVGKYYRRSDKEPFLQGKTYVHILTKPDEHGYIYAHVISIGGFDGDSAVYSNKKDFYLPDDYNEHFEIEKSEFNAARELARSML